MHPIVPGILILLAPKCQDPGTWAPLLEAAMAQYQINSINRRAAFLANCCHESQQFNRVAENLNYSAAGLMATWPNRFPDKRIAKQYERQPEKIANKVYGGRLGNGPEEGWLYRGRGLIQITGKANYDKTEQALGIPLVKHPELLESKPVAAKSAAWWWKNAGLNALADRSDYEAVTRAINGGLLGHTERVELWKLAVSVLKEVEAE